MTTPDILILIACACASFWLVTNCTFVLGVVMKDLIDRFVDWFWKRGD